MKKNKIKKKMKKKPSEKKRNEMKRNEQNSQRLKTLKATTNHCKTKLKNNTIYVVCSSNVCQILYDTYFHISIVITQQIFRLP